MPQYSYDHVHLISSDPVKTAKFYEMAFGAKIVSVTPRPDGRTRVELSLSGTRLLIMDTIAGDTRNPDAPMKRYGLEHFGLLTDNLEESVQNLKALGVKFIQEITVVRPGRRFVFIMAPENVLIELLEIK